MGPQRSNSIFSIAFCVVLYLKASSGLKCYDCGYLIDAEGKTGPIIEGETAVTFCPGHYPESWPTKDAGEVGHYS